MILNSDQLNFDVIIMMERLVLRSSDFTDKLMNILRNKIININTFSDCFKDLNLSKSKLDKLENIVRDAITDQFEKAVIEILKNAGVEQAFEIINSLKPVDESPCWRPPYDPIVHMRSIRCIIAQKKLEENEALIKIKYDSIDELRSSINDLMNEIDQISRNMSEIKLRINKIEELFNDQEKIFDETRDRLFRACEVVELTTSHFN